jgi:HKD family nuclease
MVLALKEANRFGCAERKRDNPPVRFVSHNIGELVSEKLRKAVKARLAVAFFNPCDQMLHVLAGITKLELIVSEEFTITNPYKLEKLKIAELRSVPADHDNGKLHAKVLIVELQDGSYWALVGSANMTYQGMFSNQEACVTMESGNPDDEASIRESRKWFDALFQCARPPNLDQAKLIFDARSRYRLEPGPPVEATIIPRYWALKTTSGKTGDQYWPMFQAENVIAVGWTKLPVDPSKVSDEQLRAAIKHTEKVSDQKANVAAGQIRKFEHLQSGDIVVICRGYSSNQAKDVHIFGVARVAGSFRAEAPKNDRWRFKHDVVLQVIDRRLPRDVVASALGKQSLMRTIHALEKADFDRLVNELAVPIMV